MSSKIGWQADFLYKLQTLNIFGGPDGWKNLNFGTGQLFFSIAGETKQNNPKQYLAIWPQLTKGGRIFGVHNPNYPFLTSPFSSLPSTNSS